MEYIILDLDNCVSDDSWRIHMIDKKQADPDLRYRNYHRFMGQDQCRNRHLFTSFHGRVIVSTSRPDRYRGDTEAWLARNDIHATFLFMRAEDDHRPSADVKREHAMKILGWLNRDPEQKNTIHCAYDDREDVVEMYKMLGINAKRVLIHDKCACSPADSCQAKQMSDQMRCEACGNIWDMNDPEPPGCQARIDAQMKAAGWTKAGEEPKAFNNFKYTLDVVGVSAADVLADMGETYRERNKVYGDNFKMVAKLVEILWPNGVPPELVITDQWHLFELKLVKLSRFAISNLTHQDSIHDDAVYSAMIEAILINRKEL